VKFVDTAHIIVTAGDGGVGCVSFRREKFVPKGGPDGGDGGRGGSIILKANRQLTTLLDYHYQSEYTAKRGDHGLGARRTGKSADDIILEIPVGTIVRDAISGAVRADFVDDGEEVIVARGGRGGRGNASFATAINQAPRQFEQGGVGENADLELELKLLADVGLVGLPNAGKSTLISVISAARPKIADYPFTTLVPNLGIVKVREGASFVVADIPGLIEGAHLGKGLGVQFLRHIERTRVLVFLLDATNPDPKSDYDVLLNELKGFNKTLLKKPRIVALTKMDAIDAPRRKELAGFTIARVPIHRISAATGVGIKELITDLAKRVFSQRAKKVSAPSQ
jgi:GTP-binding protein